MALAAILSSSLQSSSSTRAQTLIRLILTCAVCIHIARAFSFNDVAKYVAKPWCLMECCQVGFGWINHANTSGLQEALRMQVFGQHLVTDHVVGAVDAHLTNKDPNKPLVLSFHGPTGTGKNYVARIIAETIYLKGMNSGFVHHFSANKHFPHKRKLEEYQDKLRNDVESAVKNCSCSLFIFDEVEDMPEGLLDSIRTFLDYNIHVDRVDYRKTIFIFLSNIAAREISNKTADHLLAGRSRTEITLKEMEKVIEVTANKASGGFHRSRLIINNVVSHYFPFLPLEKSHLRKCVQVELQKRGPWLHFQEEAVDKVISLLQFSPESSELFALKGCKNVAEKVNLVVHQTNKKEL